MNKIRSKSCPTILVLFGCVAWVGLAQVNPNNPGGSPDRAAKAAKKKGVETLASNDADREPSKAPVAGFAVRAYSEKDSWTELQPDDANLERPADLFASSAKPDIARGHVRGVHSKTTLVAPSQLSISAPDGVAAPAFQLLRLQKESDRRTFRAATGEGPHPDRRSPDAVKFEAKEVAPHMFLLSFSDLKPGEYGLLASSADDSTGSLTWSRVLYTFRVVRR
jgi:hypothetical protein